MKRTIKNIIRDAEVAYKAWCERLELLENDLDALTTDEKAIVRNAFTQEYEKSRDAAIKKIEQLFAEMPIKKINSKNEVTIEEMRNELYIYCNKMCCKDCVLRNVDCDMGKMDDTQVALYYGMIHDGF